MNPNPTLKKLGFTEKDRVVIIHTDDIGMCHASVAAFAELFDFGLISSGAVMVPCPWFPEAAAFARQHPEADLGIHTTLTSEWQTYRWGPISTRDPDSGLIDEEGFLYHSSKEVQEHATLEAVQCELETQVKKAIAAGIQPTHVDTHMGAVAALKFIPAYIQVAISNHLPVMIFRLDEAGWQERGLDGETAVMAVQLVQQLEDSGLPLLDTMSSLPLETPDDRLEHAKRAFSELKPGVTHFIIHPSIDTPELRAITPDWPGRVADYQTFLSEELRNYIQDSGIQVIGYRAIKELMP